MFYFSSFLASLNWLWPQDAVCASTHFMSACWRVQYGIDYWSLLCLSWRQSVGGRSHSPHLHCIQIQCTLYRVHCTVYTVHRSHSPHLQSIETSTMYTVHCILYIAYSVQCTAYRIHSSHLQPIVCTELGPVHSTLYTAYFSIYIVHCICFTLHSTLYSIHSALTIAMCTCRAYTTIISTVQYSTVQ